MGTLLGFPLAAPLGGVAVAGVRATPIGGDMWLVQWTPNAAPANAMFSIAVDGLNYGNVIDTNTILIRAKFGETMVVEVTQHAAGRSDPSFFFPEYFATIQNNKINLTWNPPASVVDVDHYVIYWDAGGGTVGFTASDVVDTVTEDASTSYSFWTDQLAAGTYKFVIRTVDVAGNESTNTTATSIVLTTWPTIVSSLALTYSNSTHKATITWTDPGDIGAGNVRIYDNAGNAAQPYPNYASVVSTINAGVQTYTSAALTEGLWVFGARVFDGTNEEPNTSVLVAVRVDAALNQVTAFPAKPELVAAVASAGKIDLQATVDSAVSGGKAEKFKFFTNDGAGGAVDYATALGAGFITATRAGTVRGAKLTSIAYAETARVFGAIAYTTAGVPSAKAAEVTITPDLTVPTTPLSVAGTAGRN